MLTALMNWLRTVPAMNYPAYDHAAQLEAVAKAALNQQPTAANQENRSMSILSSIGHALERVFGIGVKVATASEPFIDLAFPGVAPLFNSVVTEVGKAEAAAAAAGEQNGTGPQKLALVLQSIEGSVAAYEKTNNLTVPLTQVQIEAAANAVVAFLNALPGIATPPAPASVGVTPNP